jgi:fatty-acyl-CoA synthase
MSESLFDTLRRHAARPGEARLCAPGRDGRPETLDYPGFVAQAGGLAEALRARGIGAGARVALAMSGSLQVVTAVAALFGLGATLVPLVHHRMRPGSHQAERAAAALRLACPACLLVPREGAAAYAGLLPPGAATRLLCLDDLVHAPADLPLPKADSPRLMQFSSGTTQGPKAILLGEDRLLHNVGAILARIDGTAADHLYSWLPLSHDMGLVGGLLSALVAGGSITLAPPTAFIADPLSWAQGIARHRCTLTIGPPSAYALLAARAALRPELVRALDLSALRLALTGAEAVPPDLGQRVAAALAPAGLDPHVLQPCYGLAENAVAVALRPPGRPWTVRHFVRAALRNGRIETRDRHAEDTVSRPGLGPPVDGTEILIGHAAAGKVALAPYGELFVRGASAADAILEANGRAVPPLAGGWIATGDLAVEEGGELFIIGRAKELIKHAGHGFAPTDIERAIAAATGQPEEALAAVAIPDEARGTEALVIFAEIPRGRADPALATAIRRALLAAFQMAARDVVFLRRGALPRTPSGKLRRAALAEAYASGTSGSEAVGGGAGDGSGLAGC